MVLERVSTQEFLAPLIIRRVVLDPEDYQHFAHFNPSKHYTRNLIATDNTSYTLLLLCWNAGKSSPIHDHPCDGCWMRVVTGSVHECRYKQNSDNGSLTCVSDTIYNGTFYDQASFDFISEYRHSRRSTLTMFLT
jgi:hypothetical protein